MTKQAELGAFLERAGWVKDQWGHYKKDLARRVTQGGKPVIVDIPFRIKMQATSCRIEKQITIAGTSYSKAKNEWLRIGGAYYSAVDIDGNICRIGTNIIQVKVGFL